MSMFGPGAARAITNICVNSTSVIQWCTSTTTRWISGSTELTPPTATSESTVKRSAIVTSGLTGGGSHAASTLSGASVRRTGTSGQRSQATATKVTARKTQRPRRAAASGTAILRPVATARGPAAAAPTPRSSASTPGSWPKRP